MPISLALQRLPAVLAPRGCGRSQHYEDIKAGRWTKPVVLGRGYAAWPAHETDALIAAQIGGADATTMRELVDRLHAQRKKDFEATASRYLTQPAAAAAVGSA